MTESDDRQPTADPGFNPEAIASLVLDQVTDLVFITDNLTKHIVYVNRTMAEALHLPMPCQLTCHELMRGQPEPCRHCRNHSRLGRGCRITHNNLQALAHSFVVRGTPFTVNDRNYILNVASPREIYDRRADVAEPLGEERDLLQRSLEIFAQNLVNANLQLYDALQLLGELLAADTVSLYEDHVIEINLQTRFQRSCFWARDRDRDTTDDQTRDLPTSAVDYAFAHPYAARLDRASLAAQPQVLAALQAAGISALHALPVPFDRRLLGLVLVKNPDDTRLSRHQALIATLQRLIAGALQRRLQDERVDNLQNRDQLTQFKNRHRMLADLNTLAAVTQIGVIFVNINGLKLINQKYGLAEGNRLIAKTGELLTGIIGSKEYLYRINGDEFVGFRLHIDAAAFEKFAGTLKALMINHDGVAAAVGAAWCPTGRELMTTLDAAETDMYRSKQDFYRTHSNSNRYRVNQDFAFDLISPERISALIAAQSFHVVYQPKINAHTERLAGAEGLVRLNLNGTVIPPGDFIPTLEAAHYTYLIDLFVFEAILKKLHEQLSHHLPVLPVSCNFSRHSLVDSRVVDRILALLEQYQVSGELVPIEVSERSDTSFHQDLISATTNLHAHGMLISIDDFGVSHSNLGTLADLPVSEVKFDKKLIDALLLRNNGKIRAILDGMINLCKRMQIKTTAEGVEKVEQYRELRLLGCDEIQGYYFSKPVSENAYYRQI